MKKALSFLLAIILIFSLCACGSKTDNDDNNASGAESVDSDMVETEDGYYTYLTGESAGKIVIPEDKANILIEVALSEDIPDGGVLLKNLGTETDLLYNVTFNFNQDQFFTRFAYFIAKLGKEAFAVQTAEILDTINRRESDDTRYYISGNVLDLTFDDGSAQTISVFGKWSDENGKAFFTSVVLPSLYIALGESEEAALNDAKSERAENASCVSAEGLYKMSVLGYESYYEFLLEPCPVNELLEAGYSLEDLNYIIVY